MRRSCSASSGWLHLQCEHVSSGTYTQCFIRFWLHSSHGRDHSLFLFHGLMVSTHFSSQGMCSEKRESGRWTIFYLCQLLRLPVILKLNCPKEKQCMFPYLQKYSLMLLSVFLYLGYLSYY